MTAPRYRDPNNAEMVMMRAKAPIEADAAMKDGTSPMITAEAQPASRDARRYFQTAAITGAVPS